MVHSEAVRQEIERAEVLLRSLKGATIETLTVHSLDVRDAGFLGLVISKLSPIIGNLIERRIRELLSETPTDLGLTWVRRDPGFPDVDLVAQGGASTGAGYEVKAWYALSTELTGRFRESQHLLRGRQVRLAIVAWMMSHVVYGQPVILGVLTVEGRSVALARDRHYHRPPTYLIVEPGDTTSRTINLQQTNVNGFRLQESDPERIREAEQLVASHAGSAASPESVEAQALAFDLRNQFGYRLDTNFAKIDRVDHPDIEEFKAVILGHEARGRTVKQWTRLLKALNSKVPSQVEAAERVIQAIYDEL